MSALGRYGRHAGVAWHLAEDMALVDATELDTAQLLADRAQASRVGIVVSLAAEQDARIIDAWRSLGRSGDPGEALDFAAAVRATGAMQRGRQHLVTETWAAQRALQALPDNAHRENLRQLVTELAS